MKNKIIIGITVMAVMLTAGCGCTTKKEEKQENEKVDTNVPTPENPTNITDKEMTKDQTVESLKFTNTEITYDGNMTTFRSEVTNTSNNEVILSNVIAYITYENEDGEQKTLEMMVYFGEKLQAGETRSTKNNIDVDLRKASKIEYKIVK